MATRRLRMNPFSFEEKAFTPKEKDSSKMAETLGQPFSGKLAKKV